MGKKFQVICADPPWGAFGDKLTMSNVKRGAATNYSTMTTREIADLPINSIADPDGAVLCVWVPSSLIEDGFQVMKAWGFRQTQTFIWSKIKKDPFVDIEKTFIAKAKQFLKETGEIGISLDDAENLLSKTIDEFKLIQTQGFGMGRLTRACHEICLVGINDTKIYKKLVNKSQRSVCFAPNLKHSAKPEDLQDSLDLMFPAVEKIELFARRERQGWLCVGNQTGEMLDIREALAKLI